MSGCKSFAPQPGRWALLAGGLAALLVVIGAVDGRQRKPSVLKIGTSGTLTGNDTGSKEEAALTTLRKFIKEETGLDNEIVRQKGWRELGDKMAKGELHLGVFQGPEYAWAQTKHPRLKPLAVAVNVHRYPAAFVVTRKDNPAKDFAGLQGKSLAMPASAPLFLRLFVSRQSEAAGKKQDTFFSKVVTPKNVEDALDDAVDGVVDAAAVDQAALEAYKRRKPGRFNRLREVARSQPFPPPVVAYHGTTLDEALRKRFRQGLLNASRKEKGRMMLTLFRVTEFQAAPDGFQDVVTKTRKAYPPPESKEK